MRSYQLKISNKNYTVYVWKSRQEMITQMPEASGSNIAHYYQNNKQIEGLPEARNPQDCLFYDVPGQEIFAIFDEHRATLTLLTTGENAQCIQAPSFGEKRSDLQGYDISHLENFNDPKEGFNLYFKERSSWLGSDEPHYLIKKIFIRKLLNLDKVEQSQDLVASSSKTSMMTMRFPWRDYSNQTQRKDHLIDVAVWAPDIKSTQHSELELQMNDLALNKARVHGHLYKDGTFRITETLPQCPWLVNVHPFKAWILNLNDTYFLVANNEDKTVVCIRDREKTIDLPISSKRNKIVQAYTRAEDDNPDNFYVIFQCSSLSVPYSLKKLRDGNDFLNKTNLKISGIWFDNSPSNQKLDAQFRVYPHADLNTLVNENADCEKTLDETDNFFGSISGHCYPQNNRIKLNIQQQYFFGSRKVTVDVLGTYRKVGETQALIAVISQPPGKSSEHKEQTDALKKPMMQQLMLNGGFEDIRSMLARVVDGIARHLIANTNGSVEKSFELIKKYQIVEKIAGHKAVQEMIAHKDILENPLLGKLFSRVEALDTLVGNSAEERLSERVIAEVLNACPYAKTLYTMIDSNYDPAKNNAVPIEADYQSISFSANAVKITYEHKTLEYQLDDLVLGPYQTHMKKHHLGTIDIASPLKLYDGIAVRRKCILNIWKDLDLSDNKYDEDLDRSLKKQYAEIYNLQEDQIDIAHLYLKNDRFCVFNDHTGGSVKQNVFWLGKMIEKNSESLIIIRASVFFYFIYRPTPEKLYFMEVLNSKLSDKNLGYIGSADITYDPKTEKIIFTPDEVYEVSPITFTYQELTERIKAASEPKPEPVTTKKASLFV